MSVPPQGDVRRLDNGLTLVLNPRRTGGVAAVAVHVGIGFRAEPEGCDGMAHLFEHLMFQGSAHVAAGEHFHRVEALGGRVGGHTRHDYTEFFEVLPGEDVLTAIDLEADRLAGPRLAQDTLDAQVEVIRAEIAQQVDGVPFGGFPWRHLPSVMYTEHCNTHDGYGDVPALMRVTLDDCAEFFERWYAPERVVVTVDGEFPETAAEQIVDRLSRVPQRSAGPDLDLDEPTLSADRHERGSAPNIPVPVWACGIRLPDPTQEPEVHAGCAALAQLLPHHRPEFRLQARAGWYGIPLDAHAPDAFVVRVHPREDASGEQLLEMVRMLVSDFGDVDDPPTVLGTAAQRLGLAEYRRDERPAHHARRAGATQLLFGDPTFDARAGVLAGANQQAISAAVEYLLEQHAGTIFLTPESAS